MVPMKKGKEEVNIGTMDKPKMVKMSKSLSVKVKEKHIDLLSEFSDVFTWDFVDLKVYDKNIIQHTILLKLDQNTFRQNIIRINLR